LRAAILGGLSEKEDPMSLQLPVSVARYIQIANSGTPDAVPECFAADAIVRDEGQTYEGAAAIKDWMAATKKKYNHTITPLELAEHGGQSILKARLAGSFPGSPITVNFNFALAGDKIRALKIGGSAAISKRKGRRAPVTGGEVATVSQHGT
jgi:hypothetical protein